MTHSAESSRPLRRRLAGSGALLAIVALGLVGGARPAAATNEFPPNPAATVAEKCTAESAIATVTVTNVGGLDTAHFDITVVGSDAISHYDVNPNQSDHVTFGFAEGETATIHTTADNGFVQDDEIGPINCTQYEGGIVLKCNGSQPVLVATYGNKSYVDSDVALASGETKVEAPAGEKQEDLVLEVPDHQPFNASLSTKVEGTFATLEGTPNCTPISTTSTTTSTSAVPVSVISVNTPNPPVAQVTLARTGTTTWPLIGAGVTLIGLGVAFRRRAARLV